MAFSTSSEFKSCKWNNSDLLDFAKKHCITHVSHTKKAGPRRFHQITTLGKPAVCRAFSKDATSIFLCVFNFNSLFFPGRKGIFGFSVVRQRRRTSISIRPWGGGLTGSKAPAFPFMFLRFGDRFSLTGSFNVLQTAFFPPSPFFPVCQPLLKLCDGIISVARSDLDNDRELKRTHATCTVPLYL